MGKKQKPSSKAVTVGEPAKLTHNPFAAIAPQPSSTVEPQSAPAPPPPLAAGAARSGRLVLARETKQRGGKTVVVVRGFAQLQKWDAPAIEQLARELKRALGSGGTVEGDQIVFQGDRPADVAEWLRAQGFRVDGVTS
jgi:translation initiation factor 1